MRFSHSFEICESDIDEHSHVNNVAYLRWIQEVAIAHWEAAAPDELREKYTWFVLRHEIDYKQRAFLGETLTAATWVGKASQVKCERFTKISRGSEILVQAKSLWCFFDSKTNKPSRISKLLRDLFEMS